jgi:hypothetical protein
VPRTVTPITPAEIVRSDGRRELYDSLVFANVTRIAKYGRLSIFGRPDGGLFEVVSRGHGHRWPIAAMALRAASIGLGAQAHVSRVEFATINCSLSKSTAKSSTWRPIGAHHRLCPARRRHGRANPDVADPEPSQDRTHSPLLGPFGIELSGHGGGRFCRVSGACLN